MERRFTTSWLERVGTTRLVLANTVATVEPPGPGAVPTVGGGEPGPQVSPVPPVSTLTATPSSTPTPTPTPTAEPVSVEGGRGTESTTSELTVKGGLTVFAVDDRGAGTQSIVLVDGDGVQKQLLETIGAYDGSKAVFLEVGDYQMEVTADGQWRIEVTQPGD